LKAGVFRVIGYTEVKDNLMPDLRRVSAARAARTLLLLTLLTAALCLPALAQTGRYVNIVNEKFATVSNGPQSALIVDVPKDATDAQVQDAIVRRARAELTAKARALSAEADRLERAGLLRPGQMIPLSSIVTVRKGGRLVQQPIKRRTRAFGGGTLTFRYTGFNATDQELLQRFIGDAYPRIQAVYGAPAQSGEVEIVNAGNLANSTISEVRRFAYGVYDASNNRILLPLFRQPIGTLQAMTLNLVHAFHGPTVFQYDAWEQGFARAVASIVLRDAVFEGYGIDDASAQSLFSLLKFYDILNQPALANSTFFPPSQANIPIDNQLTVAKMLWARIGMSGAAWLKVYIENQNFFNQFNAAYYAQVDPAASPSLAGNVPTLKNIAAASLPNGVEGVPWMDWYARQYVLDTAIAPGTKLYAFVIPGQKEEDGRQNHSVTLVYYRTEKSGDETLLGGKGFATYLDASNARLNLGIQSEQATIVDGEGALTATTLNTAGTDATRLTMDFNVGAQTTRVYLPVGFEGDFQGVLLGPNTGKTVQVAFTTLPPINNRNQTGNLEGQAFGVGLASGVNELGVTTITVLDGTTTLRQYRVNSGDGLYYAILREAGSGGGVVTKRKVFDSNTVPFLVSFPVQPLVTDPAAALGLAPSDFLMSWWDPQRSAYETLLAGQPSIAPIQTGRGYWLKVSPANNAPQVEVVITGVPPATDNDYTIPCTFGWNLVGSPFDQPIEINRVLVKFLQNDAISWDDAVAQNLVAAQPFAFDTVTGQYSAVTGFGGEWQGYWLRVLAPGGVTLLLPGPDTEATRSARVPTRKATPPARPQWAVRLFAKQSSGRFGTANATFGSSSGASRAFDNRYDVETPPAIVPRLTVEFPHTDWGKVSGRYVADFRDTGNANRGTWDMVVTPTESGPVTLSWDGIGNVPRSTDLTLVDKESGRSTALRSRSSYTFEAKAGVTRKFEIVAGRAQTSPLRIMSVTATPTRGTGSSSMSINLIVSRPAEVTAEVAALNGRVLRRLSAGRSENGGQVRFSWDGRSQDGNPLPPGGYTLTIIARSDDNSTVRERRVVTLIQ
jgi:hypothetical protein